MAQPPAFANEPLFEHELALVDLVGDDSQQAERQAEDQAEDQAENQAEDQAEDQRARAERRRARHKEVVARARRRHKQHHQAMREQEAALAQRLHRLLLQHEQQPLRIEDVEQEESTTGTRRQLHARFVAGVAAEERIRRENAALRLRLDAQTRLAAVVEDVADELPPVVATNDTEQHGQQRQQQPEDNASRGSWLFFDGDAEPLYFVPLGERQCREQLAAVYARMLALHADFAQRRVPFAELSCLGWTVRRPLQLDARALRFQFHKTVRALGDSMAAIVDRTWEAFHDPARFAAIYSMPVVTRVVQRVTRDMSVLLQNSPEASGALHIRYFNLLARMRRGGVVALVKTIVSPSERQGEAPRLLRDVEWMRRGVSYLLLTEDTSGDEDSNDPAPRIRLHYGCDFECLSEAHARFLMVEVLGIACRWEHMILRTDLLAP